MAQKTAANQREAVLEWELPVKSSGWIAARIGGETETRRGLRVFAHTNPVYIEAARPLARRRECALVLVGEIEDSMRFMRQNYRFANDVDKALALGRFEEGKRFYARLASQPS